MKLYVTPNDERTPAIRGPLFGVVTAFHSLHGVIAFVPEKWKRPGDVGASPGMVGVIQGDQSDTLYMVDAFGEAHALPVKVSPVEQEWVDQA